MELGLVIEEQRRVNDSNNAIVARKPVTEFDRP